MSLRDRERGSQLSSIERELIHRDNMGYVRYLPGTLGKVFFLDLSPFKHRNESEFYFTDGPVPPENTLIEVSIESVDKSIIGSIPSFEYITKKTVDKWKPIDPNSLPNRKCLSSEDFLDYFRWQYHGTDETIHAFVNGLALFTLSNPPINDQLGGFETGVFGKMKEWKGVRQAIGIIPKEFRKPSSKFLLPRG